MVEIEINGKNLDEIGIPLEPHTVGVIATLRYPKERMRVSEDGEDFLLEIPAFLTLELFRQSILSLDNTPFQLSIGGRNRGRFIVEDIRYPSEPGRELIKIKIQKCGIV